MFSTLPNKKTNYWVRISLLSANALIFDWPKILWFEKELNIILEIIPRLLQLSMLP